MYDPIRKPSPYYLPQDREPVQYKMQQKHSPKINVWAGISLRGATKVVIFTGTLTATQYVDILEVGLLPFLHTHTILTIIASSRTTTQSIPADMLGRGMRTTSTGSGLLHQAQTSIQLRICERIEYKPHNITQLKAGIKAFLSTLTPDKCSKYIDHLKKVIPKVIEVQGGPSGYYQSVIGHFHVNVIIHYYYF